MKFYIASSSYLSLVTADDFGESGGVTFYKLTPLSKARAAEYFAVELVHGDKVLSCRVASTPSA